MDPFDDSVRAAAGRLKSQLETLAMNRARKGEVFSERSEAVIDLICDEHEISREQLFSRSRLMRIARARMLVWLYLHDEAGWSYTEIGRAFGRDHTTILGGVKKVRRGPKPVYPHPAPSLSCRPVKVEGEGAWLVFGNEDIAIMVELESVSYGPAGSARLAHLEFEK